MKPQQRKKPQIRAFHGMIRPLEEPESAPVKIPCSHPGCAMFITVPVASADATFTCADHTPSKKAKALPAKDVPEEIKAWAKESSSGLARIQSSKAERAEVETSIGLQTVKGTDKTDAADDAGSGIQRDGKINRDKKVKPEKKKDGKKKAEKKKKKVKLVDPGPAFRVPASTRVPRYLRTVPVPMVPTNNPDVPYGLDDHGRPIGVTVGRPYIPPVQTGTVETPKGKCTCGRLLCQHCHPEFIARTEVLKSRMGIKSDGWGRLLDITTQDWLNTFGPPQPTPQSMGFPFFPEILGITRRQLLALLDMTVSIEPVPVEKRMLKSRAIIDKQIADIQSWIARVVQLKQEIEKSEEIIAGLSAHMMKLRLDPKAKHYAPDNILDTKTRGQYQREERRKIAVAKQEIKELRASIHGLHPLDDLLSRVSTWGGSEADYEMVKGTEDGEVSFIVKFALPRYFEQDHPDHHSFVSYAAFLRSYGGMLMDSASRLRGYPHLDSWRYLENEIVRQAISWKLVKPIKAIIEKYPDLRGTWTEEDIIQDDTENTLIIKTGGAEIGASIYNFGRNESGSMKQSGSFDNTLRYANKDGKRFGEGPAPETAWDGSDDAEFTPN